MVTCSLTLTLFGKMRARGSYFIYFCLKKKEKIREILKKFDKSKNMLYILDHEEGFEIDNDYIDAAGACPVGSQYPLNR
jgi:hypothetical protein